MYFCVAQQTKLSWLGLVNQSAMSNLNLDTNTFSRDDDVSIQIVLRWHNIAHPRHMLKQYD